jgi:hypothetical protein
MEKQQKIIILTLWFALILEWILLLVLVYFARLPYFVSLFVFFIKLLSPWLIGLNIIFLLSFLLTKGSEFALEYWRDYLLELFRFLALSFIVSLALIAVAAVLGALLGFSADRVSDLSAIKAMRGWVDRHFY